MKAFRKTLPILVCFFIILGTLSTSIPSYAKKPITLKLAHPQPTTHVYHKAAEHFSKKVAEISGGKIKIEIFPNSVMGGQRAVLELVQLGSVDFTTTSTALMGSFDESYRMFSLPFLFDNEKHLFKVFDDKSVRDSLTNNLIKTKGIRPVAFWLTGSRSYYGDQPVYSLADFKGKKVRCMKDPYILKTYECFKAIPVAMPFPDVYMGLQTGTVNAAEGPVNTYLRKKFYEVSKYLAITDTNYLMMGLNMSEKTWKKLNAEQHKVIMEAAKASEVYERQAMIDVLAGLPIALNKLKINITYPDRDSLRKATEPAYDLFKKKFGDKAYKMVMKIRTW
jgi:tripartite ATP-independent transporter DctP family solute receptor